MTTEQLSYLVNTYGDQSLPEEDRWKSIKYVTTSTNKQVTFDFQSYLSQGKAKYIKDSIGGPGFFIMDYKQGQMEICKPDDYVITFIPLSIIPAISVISKYKYTEILDKFTMIFINGDASDDTELIEYVLQNIPANPGEEFEIVINSVGANAVEGDYNSEVES